MKIDIIDIGNSKGIRLPKSILQQCGLKNKATMEVHDDTIVIKPLRKIRQNWAASFQEMAQNGDDALLDSENINLSSWDNKEWKW